MAFEVFQRRKSGGKPAGWRSGQIVPREWRLTAGTPTAILLSRSAVEVAGLAVGDRVLTLVDLEAGAIAFRRSGPEGWRVSPAGRALQVSVGKLLTRLGVPFGTYPYETIPGPDGEPLPGFRFRGEAAP